MSETNGPTHKDWDHLAVRMKRGDLKAAELLYTRLYDKVFGFAMHRVSNRAIAEDLTQDIFVKLVEKAGLFDETRGGFLVWFWQLARNTITDHHRKGKATAFSDLETEGGDGPAFDHPDPGPTLEDVASARETLRKVDVVLASASDEERQLFELRFVADLPYRDIASLTGKSEGTLRVSTNRLKRKLKSSIRHV